MFKGPRAKDLRWKFISASDSGVAQGFPSQFLAGNLQYCLTVQKDKFLNRQSPTYSVSPNYTIRWGSGREFSTPENSVKVGLCSSNNGEDPHHL